MLTWQRILFSLASLAAAHVWADEPPAASPPPAPVVSQSPFIESTGQPRRHDQPAEPQRRPLDDAERLRTWNRSKWITQILDHRSPSLLLGVREITTSDGARDLVPFIEWHARTFHPTPPAHFTHLQLFRGSDTGRFVGFASRPIGSPKGSLRAMVWEADSGRVLLLDPPTVEGDAQLNGSCAFDISADGKRVSGYVLGRSPPRLLPCIWDEVGGRWLPTLLEALHPYNPLLVGGRVVISDDGKWVAANLATRPVSQPIGRYYSRVFCWRTSRAPGRRAPGDSWRRQQASEHPINLANINDRGRIAGRISDAGIRRAAICDAQTGRTWILRPPPDHYASEATDVNNAGQVVGYYDDPPGPNGTSRAFVWQDGQARLLSLTGSTVFSQAFSIDDEGTVGGMFAEGDESDEEAKVLGFIGPAHAINNR